MKPEEITVGLDMAKRLRDAGWKQYKSSHFSIAVDKDSQEEKFVESELLPSHAISSHEYYAAPTAEEILRELPPEITTPELKHTEYFLEIQRVERKTENWQVHYRERDSWKLWDDPEPLSADTLANAAAAMYCYLSDNNLLDD